MNNNNNNNNNMIHDIQRQETLKRRWHDNFYTRLLLTNNNNPTSSSSSSSSFIAHPHRQRIEDGVDLVHNIIPSVTVVLEGRSICHRINLHSHASYHSLAIALRQMFANTFNFDQLHDNHNNIINNNKNNDSNDNDNDNYDENNGEGKMVQQIDISNAIPGHVVAYEDLENDLLLAGDLHWKDFVRVAKRIRIVPAKSRLRNVRSAKQ
ncbi:hypothetical protein RND81_07G084700 [Saponaria officinalis]|uniref:Auxin-responsive protein n=1 Tax=Saponaria officinalis TaxID=3572 RepID=A0AAW1JN68_SAPOF